MCSALLGGVQGKICEDSTSSNTPLRTACVGAGIGQGGGVIVSTLDDEPHGGKWLGRIGMWRSPEWINLNKRSFKLANFFRLSLTTTRS